MEKTLYQTLDDKESGVLKKEHIYLSYKENKSVEKLYLRKVIYRDNKGRSMNLSPITEINREEVAHLYKFEVGH